MKYTRPEMEIVELEVIDVITASANKDPDSGSGVIKPSDEWIPGITSIMD